LHFYVKIKIFEKTHKNHFLHKNNLLLVVIIFAIIIKIKNAINFYWKFKNEQAIEDLDETPTVIGLNWPLAATCQRGG
jgi:uncharacterized membrane protein YidH (DUF202 family)